MYTEIIKIIEGGLANDKEKVSNYAAVLANNLEKTGDTKLAKKIRAVLTQRKGTFTALDSLSTRPVDSESRMEIVDVTYPQIDTDAIVLGKYTQDAINSFIKGYYQRDELIKAGIDTSNSLLLYGPPGCGKTTVAQLISFTTGLPLITAQLDGLVSSLLGSTAKNIRKVFEFASKRECILFLDEFDVVAKLRDDKNELGELKRVVNSLIQNIDSLSSNSILIAATNHQELLDPAIWRRFSTVIALEKPQKEEIQKLIRITLEGTDTNFINTPKKYDYVENSLIGMSHSDIKTILLNAKREMILNSKKILTNCDVLREVFFRKKHSIESEDQLIEFLLLNGVTHKEVNEYMEIPLRKIQGISRNIDRKENVQ